MFRNYLKVAWRNLLRDRLYAAVNIFGLAVGLAVSIIVFLYIRNEITYDSYNEKADRIYRIGSGFVINGEPERIAMSSYSAGPALIREIEGIEAFCRLQQITRSKFISPYQEGYEENFLRADSTLFRIFSYPLISGDPLTCLSLPNSIVLNQSLTKKYFGQRNPIGQVMETPGRGKYTVTAVMKDLPSNTHHSFEAALSYRSFERADLGCVEGEDLSLWSASDYTFLLFRKGFAPPDFFSQFPRFYQNNMTLLGKRFNGYFYPILQPLTAVHLDPALEYDKFDAGNMSYIYGFSAIGLFLLILAGINYMNMATARSVTRAREVGLRKVMGSRRHHLVLQFLGESMLASMIGLLLALAFVELVLELSPFNALIHKELKMDLLGDPLLVLGILGVTFMLGVVSGLYPAVYLSSFAPAKVLRLRNPGSARSLSLRKVLVILQFTVSISVIIATFLMKNQVDYMRNVDLGFKADNTIVLPVLDTTSTNRMTEIRQRIEKMPGVLATTTARHVPGGGVGRTVVKVESGGKMEKVMTDFMQVGHDYVQGMALKMASGKVFSGCELADSTWEFIANRSAERNLFDGNAIGKKVSFGLDLGKMKAHSGKIVGVVEDFNVHSLRYEMRPLMLAVSPETDGLLYVRMKSGQVEKTLMKLEKGWKNIEASGSPFNPIFINEKFEKLYQSDHRLSSLMGILAYICVLISILGLLGFASYTIEQRRKEIGIRKVLGASLVQIVGMLFQDIFYLILVASILGAVIAFVVVQIWLQQYAYHAKIPVATFFFAGILAMVLAFLTVSFHSLRAALANPVGALKYE